MHRNLPYWVSCFNSFDGTANLNITGGTSPYYIDWFGYNPDSLSIGNYNYKIIDSNSCSYTNNLNISGPDSLIVSANITNVECFGEKTGEISLTLSLETELKKISSSKKHSEVFKRTVSRLYEMTLSKNS